jgi:glutamyl-tRNA reductase
VANFVAVSVEAPEPVIRRENVAGIKRRDRPVVFVDLSIPSSIAPEVKKREDFLTHDLDDLDAVIGRHREERQAEVIQTGRIVVEEVHKFLALRQYATLKPVIRDLSGRFEEIRHHVLTSAGVSAEDPVIRRLTSRLLAAALESLKAGARASQSEDDLLQRFESYQRGTESRSKS